MWLLHVLVLEHGVNDALTRRSDIRLILYTKGAIFGVVYEQFNSSES